MDKRIAYFITPHGFGHAARSTAVMLALQKIAPDLRLDIYTLVPEWFFGDSGLKDYEWFALETDVGIAQQSPMDADLPQTISRLESFINNWQGQALSDLAASLKARGTLLAVCDISPLGILAANNAGLPSVLIENFTWDWIYEPYLTDFPEMQTYIDAFRRIYRQASWLIQTEPVCEPKSWTDMTSRPVARQIRAGRDATRAALGIAGDAKAALITMGGIPEQYQQHLALKARCDWQFILPGFSDQQGRDENLILLPHHSQFFHPDLIAASDVVIAKAGYSTVAEVYQAGKPFGYLLRSNFREAIPFGQYIAAHMPSVEIDETAYRSGDWLHHLDVLEKMARPARQTVDGADAIARFIMDKIGY